MPDKVWNPANYHLFDLPAHSTSDEHEMMRDSLTDTDIQAKHVSNCAPCQYK